ncbi:hypothetical protein [Amycolatopsis regifaucium]|uniref:Virulence factor Evf domain-containing protein n=1 Tax=Amycolatopsis regifaucium TaxID=546365 RepID=A0A154MNW4_9PSEU|nr:hypothetical protein [Amycolatopsis regifaucium]KZB86008.1 hypothetical protein AVL48_27830 [Amycolatopsis regifaucium]OKA04899.1 hypothetical protein ATP06_0227905 [Amycolatopsis regifaucium]SFH74636.1 hypothetical protein SAMN04489731_106136 [Amycolatopsis regifaucium]
MSAISQSQVDREALEVALWQTPFPELEAVAADVRSRFDSDSNDQAVGNKAGGDGSSLPDLGPLSKFGSWESVASTIVHKSVTLSKFNPGSANFDPVAWNNFLYKFSTIPFFLTYTYDNRNASISKISLEKGVNAVSDLVENIMTPENFQGIVTTIKKIATLALENEGQKQKNSNQQVGVLSRHNQNLYLGAVRTEVEMEYKSGKGYEQLQQTLKVYRGYGVLDFEKCKRNAETLLKWDGKDVEEWENETASAPKPPNQSPAWNN